MSELNTSVAVEGGSSQGTATAPTQPSQPISDEQRLNDVWSNPDPGKSTQTQPEGQGQTQDKGQTQGQPAATDTKGVQPQKTETDPRKIFADASPKAFFNEAGDLDSSKVNDFFFSNGKSLLNFAPSTPIETVEEKPKEKVDPEKKYHDDLSAFSENIASEIERRKKEGATAEEILSEIQVYHDGLRSSYKTSLDLKAAIDERASALDSEFNDIREARVKSTIDRNVTELSQQFDGMVNGMTGMQVLNQFILDPKYGGPEIDRQLLKDNPGYEKLSPEKKNETIQKWFRSFQQDRKAMAHVAEFGRLRWLVQNFKPILEHAQRVGAGRMVNSIEAGRRGVSTIQNKTPNMGQKSDLDNFIAGFDKLR